MSYYVRRVRSETGRVSWTGPIRSERQAGRELDSWVATGEWTGEVLPSTAVVRAEVRAWQAVRRRENARGR